MQNIPEFMSNVVAPNPGRRHPQLLTGPEEMTPEQWAWVTDSDHDVYAVEVTDGSQIITRWIGAQDWEQSVEDYLTAAHGGHRTHTVTVWDGSSRTPTAAVRWTPMMQADMDEIRAREAQTRAAWLAVSARMSRQEATAPTENPYPTEEPLEDWERDLLQ